MSDKDDFIDDMLDDVVSEKSKTKRKRKRNRKKREKSPIIVADENTPLRDPQTVARGYVPVQGKKINKFTKDTQAFNAGKKEHEEDKKDWKGREPLPRQMSVKKLNHNCIVCNKQFSVYPYELTSVEGTSEYSYTCNKCIVNSAGGG